MKELSFIRHMLEAVFTLGIIAGFIVLGERLNWSPQFLQICGFVVVGVIVWRIAAAMFRKNSVYVGPVYFETKHYRIVGEERDEYGNPVYIVEARSLKSASKAIEGVTFPGPFVWHTVPGTTRGRYIISLRHHETTNIS